MDGEEVACGDQGGRKCDLCLQADGQDERLVAEEGEIGKAEEQEKRYAISPQQWQARVGQQAAQQQVVEWVVSEIGSQCTACWLLQRKTAGIDRTIALGSQLLSTQVLHLETRRASRRLTRLSFSKPKNAKHLCMVQLADIGMFSKKRSLKWISLWAIDQDRKLDAVQLHLDRDVGAIICVRCKFTLKPSSEAVSKHLWQAHQTPAPVREGLNAFVTSLHLADPKNLRLLQDGCAPHPHLEIQPGFVCELCEHRSKSLGRFRRHLAKLHGVKGRSKTRLVDGVYRTAMLQSWTPNGEGGYWIVRPDVGPGPVAAIHASPRRLRRVAVLHEEEERRLHDRALDCSTTDTGIDDLAFTSNWMRRTAWATTYAGVDRNLLLSLRANPAIAGQGLNLGCHGERELYSSAEEERRLSLVAQALDQFFERCEDTVRHTDHTVRCWVRSEIPGRPYKAPFELPGRCATRSRYRGCCKSLIYFVLRLCALDEFTRRELLHLRLSKAQRRAVSKLWDTANATSAADGLFGSNDANSDSTDQGKSHVESIDNISNDEEDFRWDEGLSDAESGSDILESSESEDSDDDASTVGSPQSSGVDFTTSLRSNDQLADAVGELLAFLCMEGFVDGKPSSTLIVYYSGVLSFSPDGLTFERPRNYTPKLSAMIYCIRLCLFEASLPRFAHASIGWDARPPFGNLKRFNKVRERYMCHGCPTPMGELLSLRTYGRAFARSDGPSFRVQWSDDSETIAWDGGQIDMEQFRRLGQSVLHTATTLSDKLMYGMTTNLDLQGTRDRLSDQSAGYSFVTDPANGLSSAYLDLSTRACLDSIDGLMTSECWNAGAVRRYLEAEASLLIQILLLLVLRSGQAPRISGLTSLECFNGPTTSRGVYVHDGAIAYIIRHGKARQSTNQEFNVAYYLPAQDSELIAKYLVYIRPHANMLYRQCYGCDTKRRLLFATLEYPERPLKVDIVTKALNRLTQEVCNAAFGVRIYRQLSIAITDKHVKHISRPFNIYDDKTANAHINVAFDWQSGYRPLQRGTNYGIDSAYPDSLQPALLRVYQWVSREWHQFLRVHRASTSDGLPGQADTSLLMQQSRKGTKRQSPLDEDDNLLCKRRQRSTTVQELDQCALSLPVVQAQIEFSHSSGDNSNNIPCNEAGVLMRASDHRECTDSPLSNSESNRSTPSTKETSDVGTSGLLSHPSQREVLQHEFMCSPQASRAADIASHTALSVPTSLSEDEPRPINNDELNCTLNATGKLCNPEYYQRYIPSTPLQSIQGTCLSYHPGLRTLLCLTKGRVLNPHTAIRHLKQQQHMTTCQRMDTKSLAWVEQELCDLPIRPLEGLRTISHNTYYFPDLPIGFKNFKCRECEFVNINQKNVRKHFLFRHRPSTVNVNRKADYVLEDVPLQVFEGFPQNQKVYFIPKLPAISESTPSRRNAAL